MVRVHRAHRPYASAGAPRASSRPLRKGAQPGPQLWLLRGLKVVRGRGHSLIARALAVAVVCSSLLGLLGVSQMHFWGAQARRAALASEVLRGESTPQGRWFSFADDEGGQGADFSGGSLLNPPSAANHWHPPPPRSRGAAEGWGHGRGRGRQRGAAGRAAASSSGGASSTGEPRFDSILNLLVEGALEEVSAQSRSTRGRADPFRAPAQGRRAPRGSTAASASERKSKGQQAQGQPREGNKAGKAVPGTSPPAHSGAHSQTVGKGQAQAKEDQEVDMTTSKGSQGRSKGDAASGESGSNGSDGEAAGGSEGAKQPSPGSSPKPGTNRNPAKGSKEKKAKPQGGSPAVGRSADKADMEAEAGDGAQHKGAHQTEPSGGTPLEPPVGNASQAIAGTPGETLGSPSEPPLCSEQWQEQTRRLFASARFSADWRRGLRESLSSAGVPGSEGSAVFRAVYRGLDPRIYKKTPQALASGVAASFASLAGAGVCGGAPLREALGAAARATGAAHSWPHATAERGEKAQKGKGGETGSVDADDMSVDEVEANCTAEGLGTSTPGAPLAAYAGRGFLWVASVPEQLSKARQHLAEAATMARLANRTLVLPRVGDSHVGAARLLPFCVYFDTDRLAEYVPWVTEDFFLRHVRGLSLSRDPQSNATQPSLQRRRTLGVPDLGALGPLDLRQGRHLQEEAGPSGAKGGSRFLCILPPGEDSCEQALGELQDPAMLFSTLLLTGGMRASSEEEDAGGAPPCCVVHHSGHHSARERGAAAAQEQAKEEQGLRALLRDLAPVQLLVLVSRTWFFTLNETVRRAGLQATAYAPYLVHRAAAFVRRLEEGEFAQGTALERGEPKAENGGAGERGSAFSPSGGGQEGGAGFVCVHVRLEFLVKEILKTEPFGPSMRGKLLRCARAAASLAAQKQEEVNATHLFLAADVSFREPPSAALNSSAGAQGSAAAGVRVLSDSFRYNATEARLAEGYLSEALGVLWGASGSGGEAGTARPVSWELADPRHAGRDRGVQAALDKLVCAGARVFVHGHKWCGGGQSFDREIIEMRQHQGHGEHTLAVFGGPAMPPPPPSLAPAPSPGPQPQTPPVSGQKQPLGKKGQERESSKKVQASGGTSRQKPSPAPPVLSTHALPPGSLKSPVAPMRSVSKTAAAAAVAVAPTPWHSHPAAAASRDVPALGAASRGKPRGKARPHRPPPHSQHPPATDDRAPQAPAAASQPAPSTRAAEGRAFPGAAEITAAKAESRGSTDKEPPALSGKTGPRARGEIKAQNGNKRHRSSDEGGKGEIQGASKSKEQRRQEASKDAQADAAAAEAPSRRNPVKSGSTGGSSKDSAGIPALGPMPPSPRPAPPPPAPSPPRRAQALKSVRVRLKPKARRHRSTDNSGFVDFT